MSNVPSVEDIIGHIETDDSEYESSCDEYAHSDDDDSVWEDGDDLPLAPRIVGEVWDVDDDVPLATIQRQTSDKAVWRDVPFQSQDYTFTGTVEGPPANGDVKSPFAYFKEIITDEMLENAETQTNLYSMQKDGICIKTTRKEVEIFIGLYLRMGLVQAHSIRAYWASGTRYPPVAEALARDRFLKLAGTLHFADNLSVAPDEKNADKLWKVRPWLKGLQRGLEKISPEEHQSVDEIMIPFKGHSSLKQYIRNKPHRWGFKMWGRCSHSGILHQFDVYQGSAQKSKPKSQVGACGDVVIQMTSNLEEGKNYKVFADNYFTNLPLISALKKKSLLYVGTVRANRLQGCEFMTEKELKKKSRGSWDIKVDVCSGTVAVRWFDTRTVDLVSSFIGVHPVTEVARWDKKERKYIKIDCPAIVGEYNKFMGGVDLLDGLTALYKSRMKTRRWYMYIFLHTISMAVVVAWLWYKRHCHLLNLKPIKLADFQSQVATALVVAKRSAGRPLASSPPPSISSSVPGRAPIADVRFDGAEHIPEWRTRGRCKNDNCKRLSYIRCSKCAVFLCLNKDRNCFASFHRK